MEPSSHENTQKDRHEQTAAQGFTRHPPATGAKRE